MSVCKWKDHRDILTISNKHSVEMLEVKNERGEVREKPNIARDYNDGMAEFDRSGQKISYYSCLRK